MIELVQNSMMHSKTLSRKGSSIYNSKHWKKRNQEQANRKNYYNNIHYILIIYF